MSTIEEEKSMLADDIGKTSEGDDLSPGQIKAIADELVDMGWRKSLESVTD